MAKSSKIAFIISGYRESADQKVYRQIARAFAKRKIKPVGIKIHWKRRTMSEYVEEAGQQIQSYSVRDKYVIGFSFGAYISFMLSTRQKFKLQILCSLSPYFSEEIPGMKKRWKLFMGKRRMKDFSRNRYSVLARKVKSKTILFCGDKEGSEVARVASGVYKSISQMKSLIILPGVKHNIRAPQYTARILNEISQL